MSDLHSTTASIAKTSSPPPSRCWKWLRRSIFGLALLYLMVLALLIINETQLVYPGSKYPRGNWQPDDFSFEEIEFRASDGTRLIGWYLSSNPPIVNQENRDGENPTQFAETVLLCHGNGENVAQSAAYSGDYLRQTLKANVFVYDYRGFGKSEGTPNEPGLIDESEAALKWLTERTGLSPNQIIIVGHSIGGGPAVHLAGKFGCKTLVLQRTFSSLSAAAGANYPIFPVRYLMQNQFRSDEKIVAYGGPLFQSHGTEDSLIPLPLAEKLFDAAPTENKQFMAVEGMGHFDLLPEYYWADLKAFIGNVD
jgi:pimeloyl-ACP methyl ester carboxylesterase